MKKVYIVIFIVLMSIGIIGCSNKESKEDIKVGSQSKIKVYTTIFPIYDFTKNIGKDKIDLKYIVPPSSEPHDYEMSMKTIKDIQSADLLIKNGLGVDGFADNIKVENEKLKIVTASDGVDKLTYEEDTHHEVHTEESHEHGEYDPHVWLNIDNAIKECENIKNALINADSKNKNYYEENYDNYISSLKILQSKYDETLSNVENNIILVSHDAYGYLCKDYNLNQISVTGVSPNQEPSMSKIVEITKFATSNNVTYILFDGLINPKVSQTIANEAKINTSILYSIDGITKDDFNNNEDYVSLMEKNLETLKIILK